jgi:hypothetical protein
LIAPSNAIPVVKEAVRRQDGFVADEPHGYGVVRGLEFFLGTMQFSQANLIQKTDD